MFEKRAILIVLLLVSVVSRDFAQESSSLEKTDPPQEKMNANGIYLELGGNAGIYSINYERIVLESPVHLSGRLGLGLMNEQWIIDAEDKKGMELLVPFGVNAWYTLAGVHHLELGLGATFYSHKVYALETTASNIMVQPLPPRLIRKNELWTNFSLGYRMQKEGGKFYYRIFFNGHLSRRVLADNPNAHSQYSVLTLDPWGGFSIGYGF